MLRNPEGARRIALRTTAAVCALIAVVLLPLAALRGGGARAEGAPVVSPDPAPVARPAHSADRSAITASPKPPLPAERETRSTASGAEIIVYPPLSTSAAGAPVVMMLHGMCGDPLSICEFWNRAGREGSWLVCPGGNTTCGDARDWAGSGEVKAAALDESFAALDKAYGAHVAHDRGDILIGFSRGAFVARDVAYARPGRFRGLILLGASMQPDAARLKASGIRRVVMAAGDYDMARPAMKRAAAMMSALGLPSRYVSLGRIGHALPDNLEVILRDALRWVRESP
jgi:predicted esterase